MIDSIIRPIYSMRETFWQIHMEFMREQLRKVGRPDESWYDRWVEMDRPCWLPVHPPAMVAGCRGLGSAAAQC